MKQQLPSVIPSTKRLSMLHIGERQVSPYSIFSKSTFENLDVEDHFQSFSFEELKMPNFYKNVAPNTVILINYDETVSHNWQIPYYLKQAKNLSEIPVIAYTNNEGNINSALALKAGIVDVLQIPISNTDIREKLFFWSRYGRKIKHTKTTTYTSSTRIISPIKRLFDVLVATLMITLLSPLMLLIVLAIKIDSKGSVIYKSARIGAGYKKFQFLKFRSMYQNADEKLNQLIHLNQYDTESNAERCFIKIKNDPRVTKVGWFIRKTSLDELPQLFNVLRGEMSLVGNRPLPEYEAELMVRDGWAMRFMAPAGLTGLWQITKRAKKNMSTEERVELDVTYAKNHSFWYDIKIMLKTIPAMIQEENV